MGKILRNALVILFLAIAAAAGYCAYDGHRFLTTAPATPGEEVLVDIRPGATLNRISGVLQEKGIITDALRFRLLARWKKVDAKLQAGRFAFSTGWLPEKVLEELLHGKPVLTRVTIPEGYTWWQTGAVLAQAGLVREEDFAAVVADPDFLLHYGIPFASAEGFLMPDTYLLKTPDADHPLDVAQARAVAGRLVDNFWRKASAIWADGKKPGREDLRRLVILASIVEKETAIEEERPRVAGVYANRLAIGMPLQADPTVIYGIGRDFDGNLTKKHLADEKNPYNTYRIQGLTPGPICSFGASALKAAVAPEEHKYLYFVAITDGGAHAFSRTLSEHNAAVRRYLQNRRKTR